MSVGGISGLLRDAKGQCLDGPEAHFFVPLTLDACLFGQAKRDPALGLLPPC